MGSVWTLTIVQEDGKWRSSLENRKPVRDHATYLQAVQRKTRKRLPIFFLGVLVRLKPGAE